MKLKRAFTLIELLIVVAIIAILAAIAVPNFLEAQVRAKISRCHADMRSLGLAIESYAIDYNKVPPGQQFYPGSVYIALRNLMALSHLTTPVSYISTIPLDPFFDKSADPNGRYTYTFMTFYKNGTGTDLTNWRNGYIWGLQTFGPSRQRPYPNPTNGWSMTRLMADPLGYLCIYDPSNGTTSSGVIIRTNKGLLNGSAYSGQ